MILLEMYINAIEEGAFSRLQVLQLKWCHIKTHDKIKIANAMVKSHKFTNLKVLGFPHYSIGKEGAAALFSAFQAGACMSFLENVRS